MTDYSGRKFLSANKTAQSNINGAKDPPISAPKNSNWVPFQTNSEIKSVPTSEMKDPITTHTHYAAKSRDSPYSVDKRVSMSASRRSSKNNITSDNPESFEGDIKIVDDYTILSKKDIFGTINNVRKSTMVPIAFSEDKNTVREPINGKSQVTSSQGTEKKNKTAESDITSFSLPSNGIIYYLDYEGM